MDPIIELWLEKTAGKKSILKKMKKKLKNLSGPAVFGGTAIGTGVGAHALEGKVNSLKSQKTPEPSYEPEQYSEYDY